MKNIFKLLFVSVFTIIIIFVSNNKVNASVCAACAYAAGGCVIDQTGTIPSDKGSLCGDDCTGGTMCSRDGALGSCSCKKPFGAGLETVSDQAGLSSTSVPAIIGSVIKVILGVSGTVALIFIIWGGIQWMISKGDTTKIGSARKLMTSGMIGIAIIAAAYAITDFVIKQITVIAG